MIETPGKKTGPDMPHTYASPGYLLEVTPGEFSLHRDIEVEERDPRTGKTVREKVRTICVSPIPLREARADDDPRTIVLESYHPVTQRPLRLVEIR